MKKNNPTILVAPPEEDKPRWMVCRIKEVKDTSVLEVKGVLKSREEANDYAKELGGAFVIPATFVQ